MVGFMNERRSSARWRRGSRRSSAAPGRRCGRKGKPRATACRCIEMLVDCDEDTVLLKVQAARGRQRLPHRHADLFQAARTWIMTRSATVPATTTRLKLGIPKGSLQDATIQLFARAGFNIYASTRSYFPEHRRSGHRVHADPRAGDGALRRRRRARRRPDGPRLDRGARGRRRRQRRRRSPISSTPSRASAKCAGCWPCRRTRATSTPQDLEGATIATELVRATQAYFSRSASPSNVEFSWGATEVKPPVLADAIVEVTETGSSLRANRLRIIDTVLESNTQLIANADALDERVEAHASSKTSRCCSRRRSRRTGGSASC